MKHLSIEDIELAREKILDNAKNLLKESYLLYENGFFPRSYALAHLCTEELAKIPILVGAGLDILNNETIDWKKLRKRLTNHAAKINVMHGLDYLNSEVRSDDSDVRAHEVALDNTPRLNDMKNYSLYVSFVNGVFKKPSEIILQSDALEMISTTATRLEYIQNAELKSHGKISSSVTAAKLRRYLKRSGSE